jgi:hypothetical protein
VRSVANVAGSASPIAPPTYTEVLARMSHRPSELHLDHRGEQPLFTLMFAGDVALALALARHAADEKVPRQQLQITSDGAVALALADALVVTYVDATAPTSARPA